MNIAELKTEFFQVIPSHPPNDWEIEEHLENITELPSENQKLIISQVQAIWPVSHSLCYSYLAQASQALNCLSTDRLNQWVGDILDIYEKDGLRAAQHFMEDVETNFLCRIRGESGFNFTDAEKSLTPYARSIIERRISLTAGPEIYTDTESIYIPKKLTLCSLDQDNFLLYKLIVTFQLGLLLEKTYELKLAADAAAIKTLTGSCDRGHETGHIKLANFLRLFPSPELAEDIFTTIEARRISNYLAGSFPGLWRDTAIIRRDLAAGRESYDRQPLHSRIMEQLIRYTMTGKEEKSGERSNLLYEQAVTAFNQGTETAADSAAQTVSLYAILSQVEEDYVSPPPIYYGGRLKPLEAEKGILRRRQAAKDEFVKVLASVMIKSDPRKADETHNEEMAQSQTSRKTGEQGSALIIPPSGKKKNETVPQKLESVRFLTLEGPSADLPQSLRNLADEIIADLGHIPNDYISAARGMAGEGLTSLQTPPDSAGESLVAPLTYDEWDFRRNGFRKDWCLLLEKNVQPVKGTFIDTTLEKYRGLLRQLKKQFEMLRSRERFIKRQRHGDDIDLDALIESIADTRAGKPESERLFVRLQRDERDIAVLFLVDMSSSTEGWINQALKEALLLMGEALHVIGDRFAVYGFSGMRRLRSDFYRVKTFAEPYSQEIRQRIAGIGPQEYTRMGPPLRHAIRLLQDVEAKVRLLVTLSDGKPEDYDDYKGEYAIEDTRHALIEAKAAGIHPFCITIDKKAHDYISHMYGEVNYIFVDEVRKLPIRLPEIYRILTT